MYLLIFNAKYEKGKNRLEKKNHSLTTKIDSKCHLNFQLADEQIFIVSKANKKF